MLIAMRTYSSNEYHNEQYDYAVFKMEDLEAKVLAQHFNVFKLNHDSMSELTEMVFHAADETLCEFYPCTIWDNDETDNMPVELREQLDKQNWGVIPEDWFREFTPRDALLPRGTFLVICPEGFFWRAMPQDSMLIIETETLPRDLLSRVL